MPEYKIALFDGAQRAIRAERILKAHDIGVTSIPVPRHLSSDCGIALRFDSAAEPLVLQVLGTSNIHPKGIHAL